jgi:hypothetical protein
MPTPHFIIIYNESVPFANEIQCLTPYNSAKFFQFFNMFATYKGFLL